MPNYVPKEQKPVLNMETIKKDLKYKFDEPIFWPCFLAVCLILSLVIMILAIVALCTPGGSSTDDIAGSIVALIICVISFVFSGFSLYCSISTPIQINKNRFYVFTDTIDYKAEHEEVKYYSMRGRQRRRYPSALYFKKCGRYEVFYDIRGMYEERSPRLESAAKRAIDEYELDKTYLVLSLNQKDPSAVLVYDPDEYDVQL